MGPELEECRNFIAPMSANLNPEDDTPTSPIKLGLHAFLVYVVFPRGDGGFHLLEKVGSIGKRLPSLRSVRSDYESDTRSILFFKFVRPPTLKNHSVMMFVLGRVFFSHLTCHVHYLCFVFL